MRNGQYCYPLTVADMHSRYLLGCEAHARISLEASKAHFTRLFEEHGLPKRIRTDNGVPFASPHALYGLSRLAVWWLRLGIQIERIKPGHPEQNGRHERMHRTLKAETTRPAAGSLAAQQRRFNRFREEFNRERPHEALDQATPAACYTASPRPMPDRLPPLEWRIDLGRLAPPLRVRVADDDAAYVFNQAGQEIRLRGLPCLHDASGPCANAVKDAQRTKTDAATRETLTVIWGTAELPGRAGQAAAWYRELLAGMDARTEDVVLSV